MPDRVPTVAPLSLVGRVALITGGTRGIGRAMAETFARAGADLAILARKPAELDETKSALEALGARVVIHAGSAGDADAIAAVVEQTVAELGSLDILVNNAATNPGGAFGPLVDVEMSAVRKIFEVNVEGPLLLVQAAWHAWMKGHGGVILNIASVGGRQVSPFIGAYNVSKAALIHLTTQLAGELAPTVRVVGLAPGLVKTDMAAMLFVNGDDVANSLHPLGRYGHPQDIADAALFLVSDNASWLTGETLAVDGGILARLGMT
jgi:NAD(P)-dependent dehydrogenase (short-subunit alcohol dehydrogenase family)